MVIVVVVWLVVLPIFSYFLAHQMPSKKWLITYSLFWLTVLVFVIYDFMTVINLSNHNEDNDLSLGWVLISTALQFSLLLALVGIVGRAIVLYFRHKGKNIKMLTVNFLSFFALITLPTLVYLLILLIHVI